MAHKGTFPNFLPRTTKLPKINEKIQKSYEHSRYSGQLKGAGIGKRSLLWIGKSISFGVSRLIINTKEETQKV